MFGKYLGPFTATNEANIFISGPNPGLPFRQNIDKWGAPALSV
jgi:hypothetical protein